MFATTEYRNLTEEFYINCDPDKLGKEENFFIHTPSNWSKKGFLSAGFKEDQVIVVPHGVKHFYLISELEMNIKLNLMILF